MSAWRVVKILEEGVIPFVVDASLLPDLLRDMVASGIRIGGHEDAVGVHLSVPRELRLKERMVATIDLDGLMVEIPAQDFEQLLLDVRLARERPLCTGRPHWVVACPAAALVLKGEQRRALVAAMEELREKAEEAAASDDARLAEVVRRHNEEAGRAGKKPVEPADLRAVAERVAAAKRASGTTN